MKTKQICKDIDYKLGHTILEKLEKKVLIEKQKQEARKKIKTVNAQFFLLGLSLGILLGIILGMSAVYFMINNSLIETLRGLDGLISNVTVNINETKMVDRMFYLINSTK